MIFKLQPLNDAVLCLEIPEFLTDEECDHIVQLADDIGMTKSDVHFDPNLKEHNELLRSMEGENKQEGFLLQHNSQHIDKEVISAFDELLLASKAAALFPF